MNVKIFFVVLALFTLNAMTQDIKNPCIGRSTCKECLEASGQCYWCEDKDFTENRCNFKPILKNVNNCKNVTIEDGKIVGTPITEPFGPTVQVQPQAISFKLRPGQPQSFRISVKPAKDFPVQLYYLMDMSKSMEDDQKKLKKLGNDIAMGISGITKNYELAFGSFVDKTVSPFTQIEKLQVPCQLESGPCAPTFGYKHNFNFNKNASKFEAAVAQQKISGNLDTPEGGFDGLMQVSVCDSRLGWADIKEARRIVVFVTDASPHIAGDGKIGGITLPNDGECHIESEAGSSTTKFYDKLNTMDYPSISQLRIKMKENKIVPILAVTESVHDVYEKLADQWKVVGAEIGKLKGDSSNIVDLISTSYRAIATTVQLTDDSSQNINVVFKSNCNEKTDNVCNNVKVEQQVDFDVTLTAGDCSAGNKEEFKINIPGFGEVEVDIDLICNCDCEKATGALNSPDCNNNGTSKCGICYCNPGRYGPECGCDDQSEADTFLCKRGNSTDEEVCSGFGLCVCGKCECRKRKDPAEKIYGKYCQCNNFGCDRYQGKICGGPTRGKCDCNVCKCKDIYQGANCGDLNCDILKVNCEKGGTVCSNNGKCQCDRCLCDFGYKGKHCEKCVSCPGKCGNVKDCVYCKLFDDQPKEVCDKCNLNIRLVNETKEECSYLEDNCYVIYSFETDPVTQNETILVQTKKKCIVVIPYEPPIIAIVLGTIGGIVLLGLLLLLLWKLIITAYDNYEYHQFEKDRMKSQWENAENPLYKPSKQQYQNPTYAGNK